MDAKALARAALGCEHIMHCAGPMATQVPSSKVQEVLVDPYVKGTENILSAAKAARVKRVVYTSSVAAATSGNVERGEEHVMTEADWNLRSSPQFLPLNYAKKLAEKRAWELFDSQKPGEHTWDLITILPAFMMGPPLGNSSSPSIQFCADMLNGKFARTMPPLGFACVDVRNAAAAHVLAAVVPKAKGRYLCIERSCNIIDLIKEIQPRWPQKLVGSPTPKWLLRGVAKFTSLISWDRVEAQHGTVLKFSCKKIMKDFNFKFDSSAEALDSMGRRLLELEIVKA